MGIGWKWVNGGLVKKVALDFWISSHSKMRYQKSSQLSYIVSFKLI